VALVVGAVIVNGEGRAFVHRRLGEIEWRGSDGILRREIDYLVESTGTSTRRVSRVLSTWSMRRSAFTNWVG